jgi:hypothetical protein
MSRLNAIAISVSVFAVGGMGYLALKWAGVDSINAGIWSQLILVVIVLVWTGSYLFRVSTNKMTYMQQLKEYEDAVIEKRLEELSPEELAKIQAEIDRDGI